VLSANARGATMVARSNVTLSAIDFTHVCRHSLNGGVTRTRPPASSLTVASRERVGVTDYDQKITRFPTGNPALLLRVDAKRTTTVNPVRPGNLWSLNFLSFENRAATALAPLLFAAFVVGQLVILLAVIRFFFRPTWDQQVAAGPMAIVGTALVCGLVCCFAEYFFHRYILHIESVKLLRHMCSSHRAHHKLTNIQFDAQSGTVRSAYPIMDVEQGDKSTFPPWALLAFFACVTPLVAAIAFSLPGLPILIGGYAAVAIAHFLYETIHAAHHDPYETWQPRLASRRFGPAWTWLYGFHQAHHANYHCNLNVAGFYGIPLGDLLFGTYKTPEPLLIDGAAATSASARRLVPTPRWPISSLDRAVFNRRRRQAKQATDETGG
jgi:sterol desaturase/sphingolipid hydroxylase (fatty acid hydroxylase superfamily)